MKLPILFHGGSEDSLHPRRVHLLNEQTGGALCGQFIRHLERIDVDFIVADDFQGNACCQKCLRLKPVAILQQDGSSSLRLNN